MKRKLDANSGAVSTDCGWTAPDSTWPFMSAQFSAARLQHVHNRHIFNAGLATTDDPDAPTVRVVAADFADVSEWFMGVLRQRDDMASGPLDRVRVPCDVGSNILQDVVHAMYHGCITVNSTNFAPLLQLADALLIPELLHACSQWALHALQHDGCSAQWVGQLHCALQRVQTTLPDLDKAMLEALVCRCIPGMDHVDLSILASVLTQQFDRSTAQSNSAADAAHAAQVQGLRSCLHTLFGPSCPEVFLLLLLLNLDQHGLPLAPRVRFLNPKALHKVDIQAVVQHVLSSDTEELRANVEVLHMLLQAAVERDTGSACQHVARAGWPTLNPNGQAVEVVRLRSATEPWKITAAKRNDAMEVSLLTVNRVPVHKICDYVFVYSIGAAGMQLHKCDRRSLVDTLETRGSVLQLDDDAVGIIGCEDVAWGVFLMLHPRSNLWVPPPRAHGFGL